MPLDPSTRSAALSTLTVRIDGQDLPESFQIVAVDVTRALGRVPRAHVVFLDGDAAAQTFVSSEADELKPGAEIEIHAGYDRRETLIFRGVITRQRIEAPRRGDTRLHVEAKHAGFRMALARRSRLWIEQSEADVMSDIAAGYDIAFEGDASRVHPQIVQHQATDWDFVVQRAEQAGRLLLAHDDGLRLIDPESAAAETASYVFGETVFALDLELDAESQFRAVDAGAWNAAEQDAVLGEATDSAAPAPGDLSGEDLAAATEATPKLRHDGARDQAAVDEWAAAAMLRSRLARVRGTVTVQGDAEPAPGGAVELKGLGARFNGVAFVAGVRHQIGAGDWLTTIQLGLDPRFHHERFDVSAPGAAGRLPPVRGLQIGKVTALEGDPAGGDRIEVRLVGTTDGDAALWARLAPMDAGPNRGFVFRPEIDDEVVLGFLNDDPRDPIVLGALHSSANAAPIPGSDDNHVKGYVSRSGMKLVFDDDAVSATLETPKGDKLVLSEDDGAVKIEDENGNTWTMDRDGITVESVKDIVLNAPRGDVKIEALNVGVKAQIEASVEGSASGKVKAGGQLEISGALVRIN